jgi:hypothetical protein
MDCEGAPTLLQMNLPTRIRVFSLPLHVAFWFKTVCPQHLCIRFASSIECIRGASLSIMFFLPLLIFCFILISASTSHATSMCDIVCSGPILACVQSSLLFADSKTFVDLSLARAPEAVLQVIRPLQNAQRAASSHALVKAFEAAQLGNCRCASICAR